MKKIHIKKCQSQVLYQKIDADEEVKIVVEESGMTEYYFVVAGGKNIQITVDLDGDFAQAKIVGLVPGVVGQLSIETLQHHKARQTTSNLLVKSLVGSSQTFIYKGYIVVCPIAQKTNAYQRNDNLLLSQDAHAQSAPGLEIQANDVRCTHGATIGQIDPAQLWYLGTRGIQSHEAKKLIVTGFLESALIGMSDTMKQKSREDLWQSIQKLQ